MRIGRQRGDPLFLSVCVIEDGKERSILIDCSTVHFTIFLRFNNVSLSLFLSLTGNSQLLGMAPSDFFPEKDANVTAGKSKVFQKTTQLNLVT